MQEGTEYAGEVLGTPVPFEPEVALDRGIAGGAVAGGGFGGLLAAVIRCFAGMSLLKLSIKAARNLKLAVAMDWIERAAAAVMQPALPLAPLSMRERMGIGSTEPEQLMDVEDLAGTSETNPVPVVPDAPAQTLTAEETTLDPESLSREQLEELYPAAYQLSPYALRVR